MKRINQLPPLGVIAFCLTLLMLNAPAASAQMSKFRDSTIEDRLVALALQGPLFEKGEHQTKINDAQVKKAKGSYLNLLSVSTIYSFRNSSNDNNSVYLPPGLNLGITIPLGLIFTKTSDIKIAKETRLLNLATQEQLRREVKADVLFKYRQYQTFTQMVVIQSRIIDDEQAAVLQIEKKFREGKTSIEEYNASTKNLNNELANRLKLQLSVDEMKLQLEALIGRSLESVLR